MDHFLHDWFWAIFYSAMFIGAASFLWLLFKGFFFGDD